MTPRGHIHGFSTQYSLGINRFSYVSPWNRNPYELHYDYSGRLVGKVLARPERQSGLHLR